MVPNRNVGIDPRASNRKVPTTERLLKDLQAWLETNSPSALRGLGR